jgi:hypothetical protein
MTRRIAFKNRIAFKKMTRRSGRPRHHAPDRMQRRCARGV